MDRSGGFSLKMIATIMASVFTCAALTSCGPSSHRTQIKVKSANTDLVEMMKVDQELRSLGIFINTPAQSQFTIDRMNIESVRKADLLLTEFINRGNRVILIAQGKDVSFPKGKSQMIESWLKTASDFKAKVSERRKILILANENGDSSQPSPNAEAPELKLSPQERIIPSKCPQNDKVAAAGLAAEELAHQYVKSLGDGVTSKVDWLSAETSRIAGINCSTFRIRFKDKAGSCVLNVIVNYDSVVTTKSDKTFICFH